MRASGVVRRLIVTELVKLQEPAAEALPSDPIAALADANRRALDTVLGAQGLMFGEIVFVADELLDRTQTEAHLFAEFVSRLAGSHSVKGLGDHVQRVQSASARLYPSRLRSVLPARRTGAGSGFQPAERSAAAGWRCHGPAI